MPSSSSTLTARISRHTQDNTQTIDKEFHSILEVGADQNLDVAPRNSSTDARDGHEKEGWQWIEIPYGED